MQVKIINHSKHALPAYETSSSAGLDVRANLDESIELKPLERALIKTGLFMEIPVGFECQVRPRSGLALKKGIDVLAGVVDETFRGEIGVILINLSNQNVTINKGDKIAQLIIEPCLSLSPEKVKQLDETKRGDGGFGSTGN